ncbi:MAG TPA: four helix bundle protein [Chitinophagaceae bacterium]|nr:four helix bundle protein [Chitinophagaceae bacterium]
MATITAFEELEIWKGAGRLYQKVLALIKREVVAKDFRFRDNMREAAGSVMDNIAEGFERDSRLEFINALSYSKGSTGEVRSQLFRGFDSEYWDESEVNELNEEYKNLASHIANFIKYLNTGDQKGLKLKDRKS